MAFEPTPLSESNPTTLTNAGWGNLGQVVPARNTFNTDVAGQLIPEEKYCYDERIYLKNGDEAPLCWALQQLGTETGWDNYIAWSDDVLLPQVDELDGSLASEASTILVTNAGKFNVDDLLQDEHRLGQWLVTAVNYTTNVLTVTELVAPATPLVPGDKIVRIGTALREISGHTPRPTTVRVDYYNRYVDHRIAFATSDSHAAGNFSFIPGDVEYQRDKIMKSFRIEKEKMILFGKRSWDTTASNPVGVLRGLFEWPTNTYNMAGVAPTQAVVEEWFNDFIRLNTMPGEWLMLGSGPALAQIGALFDASTRYNLDSKEVTVFGFQCTKYRTREGYVVNLVTHPLLNTHELYNWQHDALLMKMSGDIEKLVYHRVAVGDRTQAVQIPYAISQLEWVIRSKFSLRVKGSDINLRLISNIGGF